VELIGRELEIERLRLFIDGITQGAGEALLLSGDPGVGKTSLLDQVFPKLGITSRAALRDALAGPSGE
jgi:predicted ATPase